MINPAHNIWMKPQENDYFCGEACLQYASAKLLRENVSQGMIGHLARVTPNGTSHKGLIEAARWLKLNPIEIHDNPGEVKKYLDDNHVVIIGCTWGPDAEHYSILLEMGEDFVTINDQDYIPMLYIMRREDFDTAWHDTEYVRQWALVLSKEQDE